MLEFHSKGLQVLLSRLREPRKYHILDLGSPTRANVEFFADIPSRLYYEDLYRLVPFAPAGGPEGRHALVLDELLRHGEEVRFDLVLAWDLFNYLDETALAALMRRLRDFCRTDTLLYFLISTLPEMPAEPVRFHMSRDGVLGYEPLSPAMMRGPRYSPRALERMMPGFHILQLCLFGNGVQEHVYRYDEHCGQPPGQPGAPSGTAPSPG